MIFYSGLIWNLKSVISMKGKGRIISIVMNLKCWTGFVKWKERLNLLVWIKYLHKSLAVLRKNWTLIKFEVVKGT